MKNIISFASIIAVPFILWLIDVYISLRTRQKKYRFKDTHHHDFTVMVPIYGQIKYLENVAYLSQYENNVMLLTTGGETKEFMSGLHQIATDNKFKIFIASWSCQQNLSKRATSGATRDRLIRDALSSVTTQYVVPLDADSITNENISMAVGELVAQNGDIASVRVVASNGGLNWLTKLQRFEYRTAMNLRHVVPWLISGACQISKTNVMSDIMNRHSLFFQGEDAEIGLLAKRLRYKVVHIPFEVHTALPSTPKAWLRQRLAWAGGEFRLFIMNFKFILEHPFFWTYGAFIVILGFPLRYLALTSSSEILAAMLGLYILLVFSIHWRYKNGWLLFMPLYMLMTSFVLVPLGLIWYVLMAVKDRNLGIISSAKKI